MAAPSPVNSVPGMNRQTPAMYTAIKTTGAQNPAVFRKACRASAVR